MTPRDFRNIHTTGNSSRDALLWANMALKLPQYSDLIDIFKADSRKSVSKFSGLRWFDVFEDLYNGEGSLQANKTRKKH